MRPYYLLLLALCAGAAVSAQYAPPLRGPLLITGTFGELRSDHFHGGLDFRAAVGTPVYAVNGGYVSRLKISAGGYGQAVYIDHPDGKRSVYGHLEVLAPELIDTIRKLQYAREVFEVDLQLDSLSFPITKGQRIGGVGNRGFSFGPHLHFEIREAAEDVPLNPLSLGFSVPDTRKPELQRVRIYAMTDRNDLGTPTTYDLSKEGLPDTITVGTPYAAVSIKAFDRQNAMPNRNGLYRASLRVDSSERFNIVYDRIPYDKTEYLNALTDYREWQTNNSWYYLLHARTPRALFWKGATAERGEGIIALPPDRPTEVAISIADFAGNTTDVRFVLRYRPPAAPASAPKRPYVYFLPEGEASIIDTSGMRLELAGDALYDDLGFTYARLDDRSALHLSDVHQLQDERTALHGRARLHLRPLVTVPNQLRPHAYIGKCGADGQYRSVGGEWQPDGTLLTRIGAFGSYAILLDTLAPTVRIERFRSDLRGRNEFSLLLEEETGGALDYRATVDGQWILMEYDAKSGRLWHTFTDRSSGSKQHDFQLQVTDARGNVAIFERRYVR